MSNNNDNNNNNPGSDNNDDNNDNNDNDNKDNINDTEHREWKIMLRRYIKCISTKSFNETRTMHPKSKQVEVYTGSDAENVIDILFNTLLQNFQHIQEISNERGNEFIPDSVELLEYELHKIDIIRVESYIITPDWIASQKATVNPKNENDKCFQWSITAGLNSNIITEKELNIIRKLLKLKGLIQIFHHTKDTGKILNS